LLILAAIGGQHKLTRFLCSTKEVDVNIVDRNGLTALMHACKLGYQGIVEVLMETKKVNLKIVDKYGRDCFKLGGRSRSIETVLTKYQTQHELNKIIYGLSDTTISPPTPKIVQQQQILPPTYITHIVQNEDTLSGISLKYNVSQEEIKQLNHIINIHSTNSLLIPIKQKSSQVPLGTIPQLTPPKISKNFAMELISNFAKKNKITEEEATYYLEESDFNLTIAQQNLEDDLKFEYSKNIPFVTSLKPKQSEKEKLEREFIDQLEIEIKPINGIAGSGFENQKKKKNKRTRS